MNLFNKFTRRIIAGDYKKTIYLSYYYTYLKIFDISNNTNFCNSQTPDEYKSNYRKGSTGNFPAHPKLVKKFIEESAIPLNSKIIDVGHGSGLPLYVASKLGFKNLTGIEHGLIPYNISKKNLSKKNIDLIYGDAFSLDYTLYDCIFFFSPFRGELAIDFFSEIPLNIKKIITVNHDPAIEGVLKSKDYKNIFNYQHVLYQNFNCKIWEKQ